MATTNALVLTPAEGLRLIALEKALGEAYDMKPEPADRVIERATKYEAYLKGEVKDD